ncbi:MAG: serine--tRNA ligase, partial [bacterium]
MFDIKAIRDDPETFDDGLKRRGFSSREIAEMGAKPLLQIDTQLRAVTTRLQEAQTERNAASKKIGQAKAGGDEAEAQALMDKVAELKRLMPRLEEEQRALSGRLHDALAVIPNLPLEDVPEGGDESANVVRHSHGEKPAFDFQPKEHDEIGEALGLMDFETAAKLSGSRFVVLKGALARLERALAHFMLDLQTLDYGYE